VACHTPWKTVLDFRVAQEEVQGWVDAGSRLADIDLMPWDVMGALLLAVTGAVGSWP